MTKRIEQWSTELCPGLPFVAPECHDHMHVLGIVEGKKKLTSRSNARSCCAARLNGS